MKKLTAGLITSALVIVLGSTTALAVGNGRQAAAGNGLNADSQYSAGCTGTFCESTGYYFTDEDGDGICDHRGTRPNARYTQTCPYCQNDPENCPRHTAAAGDSSGQNHHGQCLHNCRQ